MSKTTDALESAVADVIANRAADGERQTARQRANVDKAFARILKLAAPRIRHFIRQYGLTAHHEDAEQVCAIAVHRAIEAYDPAKAMFTTFLNWQIRGELQSLRFRLMADQRPSARKVEAITVSIHGLAVSADGEEADMESLIVDEESLERTEEGADEYLAHATFSALVNAYIQAERKVGIEQLRKRARTRRGSDEFRAARPDLPVSFRAYSAEPDPVELDRLHERLERDREIIERSLFHNDTQYALSLDTSLTRERIRQIVRRASRHMADLVHNDERFVMLAEYASMRKAAGKPAKRMEVAPAAVGMLPAMHQPHNRMVKVSVANAADTAATGTGKQSTLAPTLQPSA